MGTYGLKINNLATLMPIAKRYSDQQGRSLQ
jgi:hypothetical protein